MQAGSIADHRPTPQSVVPVNGESECVEPSNAPLDAPLDAPQLAAKPSPVDPEDFWPRRFWDETIGLLPMFEKARGHDNYADALACFSRLAQYRYREMALRPKYDSSKRSIVSVFQAKSGGTYLHNRLLQLGYHDFWWFFPDRRCDSICYASDAALQLFMRGGCTCHSHARPQPNVLAALDRAGVERIWLHLRNPAETAVSAYHHFLGEGQGDGEIGEQRKKQALTDAARSGLLLEMDKNAFVLDTIGWHVEWVAEWLKFASRRPDLVVLSYHDELADPRAMFARVFAQLGVEMTGAFRAEPTGGDRIRIKAANDWRFGLTAATQECIEHRLRSELLRFPQFERLCAPPDGDDPRAELRPFS